MNIIVFSNLPKKKDVYKMRYTVEGNKSIEYDGEVAYPVNAVLAKTMQKGDKVKVVLMVSSKNDEGNSQTNADVFQTELDEINQDIAATISYEYIEVTPETVDTKYIHETLLRKMVDKLEPNARLIGDITYGAKPLPIVMFALMNFAEKFFACEVSNIVYGKVEFRNDKSTPVNPMICDMTALYYLNSLTNNMEYASPEEAVEGLDLLLNL